MTLTQYGAVLLSEIIRKAISEKWNGFREFICMGWFEDPQWNRRWVAKWDKGIDKGFDRVLTRGLKKSVVPTNATNTTNDGYDNPESKGNQVPKVRGTTWSCCTFKSIGS